MRSEKTEENDQLNLSGENRKIKIHRDGEERRQIQRGKKWTVVVLVVTITASLLFYFLTGGVRIFPKQDGFKQVEKTNDGVGIFGPKIYEF
jgi:hypothetical protein